MEAIKTSGQPTEDQVDLVNTPVEPALPHCRAADSGSGGAV